MVQRMYFYIVFIVTGILLFSVNCTFFRIKIIPTNEILELKTIEEVRNIERKYRKENVIRYFHHQEKYSENDLPFQYFTYDTIQTMMKGYNDTYDHCSYHILPKLSVQGRGISYMVISSPLNETGNTTNQKYVNWNGTEFIKPRFMFTSTIHGDERVGLVTTMQLIDYLCTKYGQDDERVNRIVDEGEIVIFPLFNPDGYVADQRENANGKDLNRNFPGHFHTNTNDRQDETLAIMNYLEEENYNQPFTFHLDIHSGAIVVNYPYDGFYDGRETRGYSESPDDEFYKYISLMYADLNWDMKHSTEFDNGITNGADWYPTYGSFQQYTYCFFDIFSLTLEISNTDSPSTPALVIVWDRNKDSILAVMEATIYKYGIRGIVFDDKTKKPIGNADIKVKGTSSTKSSIDGMFFKLLTPGTEYEIEVSATGKKKVAEKFIIDANQTQQIVLFYYLEDAPTVKVFSIAVIVFVSILSTFAICVIISITLFMMALCCPFCFGGLIGLRRKKKRREYIDIDKEIEEEDLNKFTKGELEVEKRLKKNVSDLIQKDLSDN